MGTLRQENRKEYRAWKAMKARCYCPSSNTHGYKINNIQVCNEWKDNFEQFLSDMGNSPSEKHSIDRIENNKNYSKENCRWATKSLQSNNRGEFNLLFTHNIETHTLKQWSKILNIKYTTLYLRIYKTNLTFEEAIKNDPFNRLILYKGKSQTLKEWCKELNLPYQTIVDRKYQKWSVERMFETPIKIV